MRDRRDTISENYNLRTFRTEYPDTNKTFITIGRGFFVSVEFKIVASPFAYAKLPTDCCANNNMML